MARGVLNSVRRKRTQKLPGLPRRGRQSFELFTYPPVWIPHTLYWGNFGTVFAQTRDGRAQIGLAHRRLGT